MAGDVRRHAGWVTEKSLAARHSRTPCGDGRGQRGASPGSRLGKPAGSGGTEATRRPPSPADHEPEFEEGTSLERHKGLRKHESSVLIQMRTRKIGLRAFLHQRRVPEVLTPGCSCGDAPETPEHLLLSCRETAGERRELPELRTRRDYEAQIDDPATAGSLARWMLRLGRLHQFDLAESLRRGEEEAGAGGEARSRGGQGLH